MKKSTMTAIADQITEAKAAINVSLSGVIGAEAATGFMKKNGNLFDRFSFAAVYGR